MAEQNETTNEAGATTPAPAATPVERLVPGAPAAAAGSQWIWGTGRRKTSVARVRIRPGKGDFVVHVTKKKSKKIDEYFTEERDRLDVRAPLKATGAEGKIDVHLRVNGGGYTGQAGAIVLGLSRALKLMDNSLEEVLRDKGFLTRDPRQVERKKYGQAGARRRFQFSKR